MNNSLTPTTLVTPAQFKNYVTNIKQQYNVRNLEVFESQKASVKAVNDFYQKAYDKAIKQQIAINKALSLLDDYITHNSGMFDISILDARAVLEGATADE